MWRHDLKSDKMWKRDLEKMVYDYAHFSKPVFLEQTKYRDIVLSYLNSRQQKRAHKVSFYKEGKIYSRSLWSLDKFSLSGSRERARCLRNRVAATPALQPAWMLTLTFDPSQTPLHLAWEVYAMRTRSFLNSLRSLFRHAGLPTRFHYLWTVESQKKHTKMPHVHLVAFFSPAQEKVVAAAQTQITSYWGCGHVDFSPPNPAKTGLSAGQYAAKYASKLGKNSILEQALQGVCGKGKRTFSTSRGFFIPLVKTKENCEEKKAICLGIRPMSSSSYTLPELPLQVYVHHSDKFALPPQICDLYQDYLFRFEVGEAENDDFETRHFPSFICYYQKPLECLPLEADMSVV